jgi:hypothetical protein
MDDADGVALKAVMDAWMSSEPKVTIARFFRQNPGVVDTLQGLAVRLAMPVERVAPEIEENVRLGIIRRRGSGGASIYMLDLRRRREIEDAIVRRAREATR